MLDNEKEGEDSRWKNLFIIYNSKRRTEQISLPEGNWEILCDASKSDLWKAPVLAEKRVKVEPISVLVLGQTESGQEEREQKL